MQTVGFITLADNRKGIVRDVELIEHALIQGPGRHNGKANPHVTRFTVKNGASFVAKSGPSVDGQNFTDWLRGVDVLVISEILPLWAIAATMSAGKRVVYIPNADWATYGGHVDRWIKEVKQLAKRDGFTVWAKTPAWCSKLKQHGIQAVEIPWVALDAVLSAGRPRSGPVQFFASVGMGGYQGRRGVKEIVAAWRLFNPGDAAELTVKAAQSIKKIHGCKDLDLSGITVIEANWSRQQIEQSWRLADVVLYPTKWDGFGLSLSEALNAGCPVIAPDIWPMNEQVTDGHDGLLIGAGAAPDMRLAPCAEISVTELAAAMKRMMDPELRRRLTVPQPGRRKALQRAMITSIRAQLLGEAPARVLIVSGNGKAAGGRRSELWWADAFAACGFAPTVVARKDLRSVRDVGPVDFAIIGKASVDDAKRVRKLIGSAPLLCWHHDLIDFLPEREAWQRKILNHVDLCLVSEGDLDRFSSGSIETLHPGHKVAQVRPLGPPRTVGPKAPVAFLGGCVGLDDPRARVIRRVPDLLVHGPADEWRELGINAKPQIFEGDADAVLGASYALSVSRSAARSEYTSNRLFAVMASGGVPIVQTFPHMDRVVDIRGLVPFKGSSVDKAVERARALSASERRAIQWAATEDAWRSHTWDDRALSILSMLSRRTGTAFAPMWDERARELGPRAVAHVAWTEEQFEAASKKWWKVFSEHFKAILTPEHTKLLDYGCGIGRFTSRFAGELGLEATGVDVSPTMVGFAKERAPGLDFRVIDPSSGLPFEDDSFDIVFTSTVLQHIPDAEFRTVVDELNRVLRPGGIVFLFENCHQGRRESRSGHVVFRSPAEYQRAFPGIVEGRSWMVEGERHVILATPQLEAVDYEVELSFVVPCHRSGVDLLNRQLRSFAEQDADKALFEVVIGCDDGAEGFELIDTPFHVELVPVERTKDLPHRNHARNAAIRAARGRYLWVVDSDFVFTPNAVSEALRVMDGSASDGRLLAVSPILKSIEMDPMVWIGQTESWTRGDEKSSLAQVIAKTRTGTDVYSGHGTKGGEGKGGLLRVAISEGFPLTRADVFEALEGFDERFLGWGGNKEELTRRLGELEAAGLTYQLLTTVTGWHQPHPQDPQKTAADTLRRANQQRFKKRLDEMRTGESWWLEQVSQVDKLAAIARGESVGPSTGGSEFGLLTTHSEFWNQRALLSGFRAVADLSWTPRMFEKITEIAWRSLKRQIMRARKPSERRVLDFGCGAGRYTSRLAGLPGVIATGVDIAPAMVNIARMRHPELDVRLQSGRRLPFGDAEFHVIVSTMTLQHIPDHELANAVKELMRVARPGALLLLLERTDQKGPRVRGGGVTTSRREVEYRSLLPGVVEVETVFLGGVAHSLMLGRKPRRGRG